MAWQREVRRPSTSHVHRGPKNKTARRLVFVAAATVAGLILILALLRVPAVQLQILRWVAGGADGAWRFDVQRVSVGPGGGGNLVGLWPGADRGRKSSGAAAIHTALVGCTLSVSNPRERLTT